MRIGQLQLRFEDESELARLWAALPAKSQMSIARVYARLCIRAAKAVAPVPKQKGQSEPCHPKC